MRQQVPRRTTRVQSVRHYEDEAISSTQTPKYSQGETEQADMFAKASSQIKFALTHII